MMMKKITFDTKNPNNFGKLLLYLLGELKNLFNRVKDLENAEAPTPTTPTLEEVVTAGNNVSEKTIIVNSANDDQGFTLFRDAFNYTRITKSRIYTAIGGVVHQAVFPQTSGELVTDVPNNDTAYVRKYRQWVEATSGGTPTLDEVLAVDNLATNKYIFFTNGEPYGTSQSHVLISNNYITLKAAGSNSGPTITADLTQTTSSSYINPENGAFFKVSQYAPPVTPTEFGYPGEVRRNATHIYFCVAVNIGAGTATWVRSPIETTW